jgi:hypothetical protein
LSEARLNPRENDSGLSKPASKVNQNAQTLLPGKRTPPWKRGPRGLGG